MGLAQRGIHRYVSTPVEDEDDIKTIFRKFVMTGDDRNIVQVYVKGRQLKDITVD